MNVQPCSSCDGNGETIALVNYAQGGCRPQAVRCRDCKGDGIITPERAAEIAEGKRLREDRITRDLSLREEAARLDITPMELSRREHP